MVSRDAAKSLNRSRPLIGAATAFLAALSLDLFGVPRDAWLYADLKRLFETTPILGYGVFTIAGFAIALAFRLFEDRYVYQ